jgi:hypothetical protein
MRSLSAPVLAALAGSEIGLAQLVRIQLTSGDVLLSSANRDITWDGLTYLGAYGLGTVSPVDDKPGEAQGLSLQLAGGSSADISRALDASDEVQGVTVEIRTAVIDLDTGEVLDAPIDFVGRADTMAIQEDGDRAVVTLTVESAAVDLLRGTPGTYSHADQVAAFPGDRAFEYVVSQADQLVIWPAREFFFK